MRIIPDMFAPILAGLMLASSGPIGPQSPRDELMIVGGEISKPGSRPSVVALEFPDSQLCAATVVAPTLLVTAAHCFRADHPADSIRIHQGGSLADSTVSYSKSWGVHPDYRGNPDDRDLSYDYAYIELKQAITLERYPRPLTTQEQYDKVMRRGQPILLVGYGENEEKSLGTKREVNTTIAAFTPLGRQFLTAGDGKDSCRGDSGGPALAQDLEGNLLWLGVLSSGAKECGKGGYYGVPFPVLSWLKSETSYEPGDCLDKNCINIRPDRGGQAGGEEDSGACASSIRRRGSGSLTFGCVLAALLGRVRRKRSLHQSSKSYT